jgi:hypothetical protein
MRPFAAFITARVTATVEPGGVEFDLRITNAVRTRPSVSNCLDHPGASAAAAVTVTDSHGGIGGWQGTWTVSWTGSTPEAGDIRDLRALG